MEKPNVLKTVQHYQRSIENSQDNEERLLHCIRRLVQLPIKVEHLQETGVGKTVNSLRKFEGKIGKAAKDLVSMWKAMVVAEEVDTTEPSNSTPYKNGCNYNENENDHDDNNDLGQQTSIYNNFNNHRSNSSPSQIKKRKSHENVYKKDSDNKHKHADHKQNKVSHSNSSSSSYKEKDNQNEHKSNKHTHISSSSKHKLSSHHHKKYEKPEQNRNSEDENDKSQEKENSCDREKERKDSKDIYRSIHEKEHKDKNKEYNDYQSKERHQEKLKRKHNDRIEDELTKQNEKHNREKNYLETEQKPTSSSSSSEHINESKNNSKRKYEHCSDEESLENHKSKGNDHKKKKEEKHKSSKHKEDSHSKKDKHNKTKEKSDEKKDKSKKSSSNSNSNEHKRRSDSEEPDTSKVKVIKIEPETEKAEVDNDGIDSSMGANFADVLGMLNVPVKKSKKSMNSKSYTSPQKTKDTINKNQSSSSTYNSGNTSNDIKSSQLSGPSTSGHSKNTKPDLLSSSAKLEPLDPSIALELPIISNNYKPLPVNPTVMDCVYNSTASTSTAPKSQARTMTDSEALTHSISSKTMRTKIYSGVKTGQILQVPTLFDLCIRLLQKNIDALEYTGGVPFEVLRPVIERATPQQLLVFEEYNPYIMEDSDVLWQQHVQRHFRAEKRMEMESWREMFFRCQDDKERKLSKLAENIKKSQKEIAAPVRKTQLAFVDSLVKPPRNVQRKQEQFGTKSKLIATPAARVAALSNVTPNAAKTGDVRLRVAASVRDHAQMSSTIRAKKAPLMAKTLQFMRGRHKR